MYKKMTFIQCVKYSVFGVIASFLSIAEPAQAQLMGRYTMTPPLSDRLMNTPMIMLTLAADHQLFMKAYNDYDDLTGDEIPDTTYNHDFAYVGYFDNKKCYSYTQVAYAQEKIFVPTESEPTIPDHQANLPAGQQIPQYCPENEWSGNFLNWATMTRIDLIRMVLYGGYRWIDTPELTVLERSYLPHDAHSFAKHYDGDDIKKLIDVSTVPACPTGGAECGNSYTFCNTSKPIAAGNHLSHELPSALQPPLLRVVKGNYSFWSSSERLQCLTAGEVAQTQPNNNDKNEDRGKNTNNPGETAIYAYSEPPESVSDFIVRVEVCGTATQGSHKCKAYGQNLKPIGLLQEYGESGVQFGLITRGYNSNKSYGVLRKNISSLDDEVKSDGTFFSSPLAPEDFTSRPTRESIIGSLNALRIVDYRYDFKKHGDWKDNYYVGTYLAQEDGVAWQGEPVFNFAHRINPPYDCAWGKTSFENGQCRNWGNPFSLLMAESYRYFAGASTPRAVVARNTSDKNLIPGLSVAEWNPPFKRDNITDDNRSQFECLNMNVLAFNASAVSYDSGAWANESVSDLGLGESNSTVAELTDIVGRAEINPNKLYFVGSNGSNTSDGQCTPKSITNLSSVKGTCPDAPRLEGSYLVAGLAHYVHTNNVIPDVPGSTIATYGVDLAGAQPNIQLTAPGSGRSITIIPACRNLTSGGNCAIVHFTPLEINKEPTVLSGRYFVAWEDSEQGGDYDQDINGIISYRITSQKIEVSTKVFSISTPDVMNFGFIISGTGTDRDRFYPGTRAQKANDREYKSCESDNSGLCLEENGLQKFAFNFTNSENPTVQSQPGEMLERPLYYAAKWGSFMKELGNAPDPAAKPRGYAAVTNPAHLEEQLRTIFESIINRPTTSASAAISASTLSGEGFIVQSLYQPLYKDSQNRNASWVGMLNGLFIDSFGNLREDSDGNGQLTDADKVVEFFYSPRAVRGQTTLFNRYDFDPSTGARKETALESNLNLDQLKPLWSARDQLANVSDVVAQRAWGTSAQSERYIFTAVDQPKNTLLDGQITSDETLDFSQENAAQLRELLDVPGEEDAIKVINYIRGQEIEGTRNRTVNWGQGEKVWRLGDIVHSTPAVVGRPSAGYDVTYGDDSYAAFREKYRNRRQMVYVGANDGLLHAFNGGFFNPSQFRYQLTPTGEGSGHALGAEMWAYAPYNLLPHLKWLTRSDYSHVYYVDSKVHTFDVNIFTNNESNTYPGGWGTILVAGMRFGGGPYDVRVDNSSRTLRSAFIIMDITDPEKPPRVLAEISHPDLGYTVSDVELVKFRKPNPTTGSYSSGLGQNDWYLVFGSGPKGATAIADAISDQPAKLFSVNLKDVVRGEVELLSVDVDDEAKKSFVGGIKAADWNRDYMDDVLYFGLVGDHGRYEATEEESYTSSNGALKHVALRSTGDLIRGGQVTDFVAGTGTDLPVSAKPLTVRDRDGIYWVFAGTGRFYVKQDLELGGNKYFGIKANNPDGTNPPWLAGDAVDIGSLRNVTEDKLYMNSLGGFLVKPRDENAMKLDEYLDMVADEAGWYRNLPATNEANFTNTAFSEGTLVYNSYVPDVDICQQAGYSNIYVLDMFTGLPQYNLRNVFTGDEAIIGEETVVEVTPVAKKVGGILSDPAIVNGKVLTQNDRAEVDKTSVQVKPGVPVRRAWREVPASELQ